MGSNFVKPNAYDELHEEYDPAVHQESPRTFRYNQRNLIKEEQARIDKEDEYDDEDTQSDTSEASNIAQFDDYYQSYDPAIHHDTERAFRLARRNYQKALEEERKKEEEAKKQPSDSCTICGKPLSGLPSLFKFGVDGRVSGSHTACILAKHGDK